MKIYVLYKRDENGNITTDMDYRFGRSVRAYKSEGVAKSQAKKFDAEYTQIDLEKLMSFSFNDGDIPLGYSYGNRIEDIVGKVSIAPHRNAQIAWELLKKNPNNYVITPSYIVKKEAGGVIMDAELVGLDLVPKFNKKV